MTRNQKICVVQVATAGIGRMSFGRSSVARSDVQEILIQRQGDHPRAVRELELDRLAQLAQSVDGALCERRALPPPGDEFIYSPDVEGGE